MKILKHTYSNFEIELEKLCNRSAFTEDVDDAVSEILKDIKQNGDKAVLAYAKKYDNVDLDPKEILVSQQEIDTACEFLDIKSKAAIEYALESILSFSKQRIPKTWHFSPRKGLLSGKNLSLLIEMQPIFPVVIFL